MRTSRFGFRRSAGAVGSFASRLLLVVAAVGAVSVGSRAFAQSETVDHALWTSILGRFVSEEGWVDYDRLRSEAKRDLDRYLDSLADVKPGKLGDDERKAFWINAYNALCIDTLISKDLPSTVPHKSFLGIGSNIFVLERREIGGRKRSLDDIEHGILRKKFDDARIHAALVCGASSCPRLRTEAYVASRLDEQLDEETRRWIREGRDLEGERKNYLDRERKVFYASKIFSWFKKDFGGSDRGVLEFITKYASQSDREFMEKNDVSVRYLDYDWTLNRKKT